MLVWQAHKGKIESVAFGPGGLLASATGGTRTVHLWEAHTGKLVRRLSGSWPPEARRVEAVKSVAFAPDAPLFAAGHARSVTLWNSDTWELQSDLGTRHGYYELAFSRGPSPTLAASDAMRVSIWDDPGRPTGHTVRAADRQFRPIGVSVLDFSPDGKFLAASNRHEAGLWHTATANNAREFPRPAGNHRGAVRFSPDGATLAIAMGKWVALWDLKDEKRSAVTFAAGAGRQPAVWALGWLGDGNVLMSAGADGFVRLWDVATQKELRSFAWGIGKVYSVAFSPDGLICAAGGENGQIVVWDVDV